MAQSLAITSAGTTLGISAAAPTTYTATALAALTYTMIGEISDMGEFGREYALVEFKPIGDRRTVKRKGSYNDGKLALKMARVPTDVGQMALIAARDTDASVYFKITTHDGHIFYFSAQVMSYTTNIGSVDQILQASVTVEIDNDIIEV